MHGDLLCPDSELGFAAVGMQVVEDAQEGVLGEVLDVVLTHIGFACQRIAQPLHKARPQIEQGRVA